jgi:hypothetical protein
VIEPAKPGIAELSVIARGPAGITEVSAITPSVAGTARVPAAIALAAVMSRAAPGVGIVVHSEAALEASMGALPGPVAHEVPQAWEEEVAATVVAATVVAVAAGEAAVVVEGSGRDLRGKEYESKA